MIQFGRDLGRNLEAGLTREWLETDGWGGYASGSLCGANTRRYHGLLVAAAHPPVGRHVLLSKLEEVLRQGGESYALSANLYDSTVHPRGFEYLIGFRLDPWPIWTYEVAGVILEKSVFMPHLAGVAVISYQVREAPGPLWLDLKPLMACRDSHSLGRAHTSFNVATTARRERSTLQPWGPETAITLVYPGAEFLEGGLWYYDFFYPREQERGLDCREDLYSPGEIRFLLSSGERVDLVACTNPDLEVHPQAWEEAERQRRERVTASLRPGDAVGRELARAADQFLVRRWAAGEELWSVIAGYPWFTDWGRDTMIALPGLALVLGRGEEADAILRAFAGNMEGGLIPNTFGEDGKGAAYNTVDASLWFVNAVRLLAQTQRGMESVAKDLYDAKLQVLDNYRAGTSFGIRMDKDGLITAGDAQTQLTWMDAKRDNVAFTPRAGKPVEISALWYNALRTGQYLAAKLGEQDRAAELKALSDQVRVSFCSRFWNEAAGCCFDVIGPQGPDPSIRPNQVIGLALPYTLLPRDKGHRTLETVDRHLLTPYGLRTLSPEEPRYQGRFEGDMWKRDSAYHQGTVWPWLLGPYVAAHFWLNGIGSETRRQARALLQPLVNSLGEAGLGTIAEVYDGEEPQRPGGCIAQAWSVAEVLRCWVQYRLNEA